MMVMRSHPRAELYAAFGWFVLAAAAVLTTLTHRNPGVLLAAGALAAFVVPERDEPGWHGMLASSLIRIGDTAVFAAIAWALASFQHDTAGAGRALAVLALGLVSPYVRVRARSLGLLAASDEASFERGIRLVLVAAGFFTTGSSGVRVGLLVAATYSALRAFAWSVRIWRGASRV